MGYKNPDALVTTDWFAANISASNLSIIDASFYLPAAHRDPKKEFYNCHIPGATFFDINEIADTNTDLPHMLPTADEFSKHAGSLGINNDHHVICYDSSGGPMAAMRVWWTFRVFGHDRVSVLSGGLPKWQKEGHSTSSTARDITEQQFIGDGSAIKTGKIGGIYGVDVFVTSNAPTCTGTGGGRDTDRAGVLLHKDALVLAEQVGVRSQTQYKQEYLGDLFTADTIYGVKELRDNAGVAFIVPAS